MRNNSKVVPFSSSRDILIRNSNEISVQPELDYDTKNQKKTSNLKLTNSQTELAEKLEKKENNFPSIDKHKQKRYAIVNDFEGIVRNIESEESEPEHVVDATNQTAMSKPI